ncbi:MAG: serine/threonine phosphatase [Oculatellaceae cyanobacterium Prado106]|jgi:protein phosphatase|nr:serine/threonine phosphatase [Oculatellaceae cyanobacterium Prado106]
MLVCSHCQFQNPDANKFCQNCGGSLAEATYAPGLEPESADDLAEAAASFGNFLSAPGGGSAWFGILALSSSAIAPSSSNLATPANCPPLLLAEGQFLDSDKRYQLATPLPELNPSTPEVEAIVSDAQPLQPPHLDEYYRQQLQRLSDTGNLETDTKVQIPAIAQPYLELRKRHPFLPLPKIHDAWIQNRLEIVLLENRSTLPTLLERWSNSTFLIEVIDWLEEMVTLWDALKSHQCGRSLLQPANLRIDEEGFLCLQRLDGDLPEHPVTLSDLGRLWNHLYEQSQQKQQADLTQLFVDLIEGDVRSGDELRSRLDSLKQGGEAASGAVGKASTIVGSIPGGSTARPTAAVPPEVNGFTDDSATMPEWQDTEDSEDLTRESEDFSTVALPMQLIGFEDAGLTDIGSQRNHNEDCFSLQSQLEKTDSPQGRSLHAKGLYILCDGMGGHAGGEVASALAVDTLKQLFNEQWQDMLPNEAQIREAIAQANRAIFDLNQERASSGSGRMGTTLALALVQDNMLAIAHVGDSRIYRYTARQGLEQLTIDHEVGQREMQRGVEAEIAYARPDAYQLTQALGPRDENGIKPEVRFLEINEDQVLLLCSDGLTDNNLLETYWETQVAPLLEDEVSLDQGVSNLITLANQYNGHDNITAIAIRVRVLPNLNHMPSTKLL